MSTTPQDLKYTGSHEWARLEEDGTVTIGISDHAQEMLGDLVYVELPEIENQIRAGEECAVVESVKAASDVYAPIAGEVIEVNDILQDVPGTVNSDPYGDGWLFRIRPSDEAELENLMSAEEYKEQINAEA